MTSDLVYEIITSDIYNVRLLSLRECHNLNERKLMQALEYAIRPSRPKGTPRLKGLYIFGNKDEHQDARIGSLPAPSGGVLHASGAQIGAQWNYRSEETLNDELYPGGDPWFGASGSIIKSVSNGWANTMAACEGLIAFDAVLCSGPRHKYSDPSIPHQPWYLQTEAHIEPKVAQYAVGACTNCDKAPEGVRQYGKNPAESFPLLKPPPTHASTVKAATRPACMSGGKSPRMVARCLGRPLVL